MKRPWHYWLAYGILLVLLTTALSWLTREALILDRAEADARRQAEMEDNIGRALWRMDVHMMPLIAKEAARPYFLYQPFYVPPTSDRNTKPGPTIPSPLLTERSEFVVMNFQLCPDNRCVSAQLPERQDWERAIGCGAKPQELQKYAAQLDALQGGVAYHDLLGKLPQESFQDALNVPQQPSAEFYQSSRNFFSNTLNMPENSAPQQAAVPQQQAVAQPYSQLEENSRLQRSQSLNASDLGNRNQTVQNMTQQQYLEQRKKLKGEEPVGVREGISRPVWIGERLLLARRVDVAGESIIQGCWLDWPSIKKSLLREVVDLLPAADLVPVDDTSSVKASRILATLPVQLLVGHPGSTVQEWTTIRTSLGVAWLSALFVAIGAALVLHGVLTLSERRAAFVSAVTHELRTPLTTFRMYAEMLAHNMVPDAAKRQQYLETLRVEADRLAHLVENVLSYARLENGRQTRNRQHCSAGELLDRVSTRFTERAAQAEMKLVVHANDSARQELMDTDPGAVEQILFNLLDNACKYAARSTDRSIELSVERAKDRIRWVVADHGPGIAADVARRLFRPFSKSAEDAARSAPGVGLGLALSLRLARELGGKLQLDRGSDGGARFVLDLPVASS